MKKNWELKVRKLQDNRFEVRESYWTEGNRLNAYESEPSQRIERWVYQGTITECSAFIQLVKDGHLDIDNI